MAKRFTDSDKWQDVWFRRLSPDMKLAYLYILDRCDMAGTIELDRELAEFQMGCPTDWEGLVKGSGTRLVPLANGRLWVRKFISYQNGNLSPECNAHKPIIRLVDKYELPIDYEECAQSNENKGKRTKGTGRVQEPLAKGPGNSNGNSNGNGTSKGKSKSKSVGQWSVPERLDSERVRELLEKFTSMRATIGHPIKNLDNASVGLKNFRDQDHLAYALEFCIANEYQGLKPDYDPLRQSNQPRAPVTFAQQSVLNTKEGGEKFLKEMQELFGDEETGLSELQDGNGNTLRLLGEGSK
jgi:hypothetical protein